MRSIVFGCLLLAAATAGATTQESAAQSTPPIRDEAPVVVSGKLPGPGMWKVSRNGHVMYLLGTVPYVPKGMEWISLDVEKILAQAGEVVYPPGYTIDFDVGFFGKLALIPTALGVPKNPDGKTLQDVVPTSSYARWLTLKQRYLGRDGGVEKMRPIFAAASLEQTAIKNSGLVKNNVWPVIKAAVKKLHLKVSEPEIKTTIKDPKAALKELRDGNIDDLSCFDKTLANLETDLARMAQRANAWAVGDIGALRALPLGDQQESCTSALLQTTAAQKRGLGDVAEQLKRAWLPAAESAIANNPVSFAVLPMSQLLESDGYLAALQAKGYTVEAPEAPVPPAE